MRQRTGWSGLVLAALIAVLSCSEAAAEVVAVGANGFTVREKVHISASPQRVYAALIRPADWWASDHTFSGSAANLSLDARAGGCFCEVLPDGGSVQHQVVVLVAPGKKLVLRGPLGPFQGLGVDGASSWVLSAAGDGTDLTLTNTLGGFSPEGFGDWSKAADEMLAGTVQGLKRFLESGSPNAPK